MDWNTRTKTEALNAVFAQWQPVAPTEMVPLAEAIGRITANTLYSRNTLPVHRVSMFDGIAVNSARFSNGVPDTSTWQEGCDYVRADTGDDFPDQFDAIIPIEEVEFIPAAVAANGGAAHVGHSSLLPHAESGETPGSRRAAGLKLTSEDPVVPGSGVREAGSQIREGDWLISAGVPIRPCDLAALALGGIDTVPVRRKPMVAFIPTGSELIPVGTKPQRGQSIESNSLMAKHMLLEMGAAPLIMPIVKDRPDQLIAVLTQTLPQADIVIMNGGSSLGAEDFTAGTLAKRGEVLFHGVAAGPGRPMSIAIVDGKPVINLPGPVVAAYYGLDWCVRPIVAHYLGVPPLRRPRVSATLAADMSCPKRISFLYKVQLEKSADGGYRAFPVSFKTEHVGLCMGTNAQFVSEIGKGGHGRGDTVEVELLRSEEYVREPSATRGDLPTASIRGSGVGAGPVPRKTQPKTTSGMS